MTEVDVYIEAISKKGYVFEDELSKFGSDTNILKYRKGGETIDVYFNFKTGVVKNIYANYISDNTEVDVKEIKEIVKPLIRNITINEVLK